MLDFQKVTKPELGLKPDRCINTLFGYYLSIAFLGVFYASIPLADCCSNESGEKRQKITWRQVSEATGISPQAIANLASRTQIVVTNTAHVEGLCRYFRCSPDELIEFVPVLEQTTTCDVNELYPGRRKSQMTNRLWIELDAGYPGLPKCRLLYRDRGSTVKQRLALPRRLINAY